jgi:hypothetical protein
MDAIKALTKRLIENGNDEFNSSFLILKVRPWAFAKMIHSHVEYSEEIDDKQE